MIKGKYQRNSNLSTASGTYTFIINNKAYISDVKSYDQYLEIQELVSKAFESGYQKAVKQIRKQITRVEKKSGCYYTSL